MKSFIKRSFAVLVLAVAGFGVFTTQTGAWDRTPYLDGLDRQETSVGEMGFELVDMRIRWRSGWMLGWVENGEPKEVDAVIQYLIWNGPHPTIVYQVDASSAVRRLETTEPEYMEVLRLANDFNNLSAKASSVAIQQRQLLDRIEESLRNSGLDVERTETTNPHTMHSRVPSDEQADDTGADEGNDTDE